MESDSSAGLVILIIATPILALILMFGMLANKGLIGTPSVNKIKGIEITRTQNNSHNNIKNDKQDF